MDLDKDSMKAVAEWVAGGCEGGLAVSRNGCRYCPQDAPKPSLENVPPLESFDIGTPEYEELVARTLAEQDGD